MKRENVEKCLFTGTSETLAPTRGVSAAFKYAYEHATGHSGVITNPKGRYFIYDGTHEIRAAHIDGVSGWNNITWYYRIPLGFR